MNNKKEHECEIIVIDFIEKIEIYRCKVTKNLFTELDLREIIEGYIGNETREACNE